MFYLLVLSKGSDYGMDIRSVQFVCFGTDTYVSIGSVHWEPPPHSFYLSLPLHLYQTSPVKVTQQTWPGISPSKLSCGALIKFLFLRYIALARMLPTKDSTYAFSSDTDEWKSFQRHDVSPFSFQPQKLQVVLCCYWLELRFVGLISLILVF